MEAKSYEKILINLQTQLKAGWKHAHPTQGATGQVKQL